MKSLICVRATAVLILLAAALVPETASAYNCNIITQAVQNRQNLLVRQVTHPALSGFTYHPSIMSLNCAGQMDSIFNSESGAGMAGSMGLGGMPLPAEVLQQMNNQIMDRVTNFSCTPVEQMQGDYQNTLDQAINAPAQMIPSVPPYNVGSFSLPPVTAQSLGINVP